MPPAPEADGHTTAEQPNRNPSTAQDDDIQRWNSPRRNVFRILAIYYSFIVFGLNDGAYGALLPHLEKSYSLSYTLVSLIFLSPLAGYTTAALLNSSVHVRFGQRGVALLATCCQVAAYAVVSAHPPYPVVVVMYALAGFGYGLIDGAWNAWTGSLSDANGVQGLLSACYSIGATVSPVVATSMSMKHGWGWYTFYWFMTGCATLSLIFSSLAFWDSDSSAYQSSTRTDSGNDRTSGSGSTREALRTKATWLGALYFFIYFGTQISLAGWIITFMLRVRHASPQSSSFSTTGFQAGQAVGRAAFGLVAHYLPSSPSSTTTATSTIPLSNRTAPTASTNTATASNLSATTASSPSSPSRLKFHFHFQTLLTFSLLVAITLQLVFWLVPSLIVSAIAVSLLGFFLGPLFPAGVVAVLQLLPKRLHVSAIGFATALGGVGGAVWPFAVGAVVQAKGVTMVQPVVLAGLVGVGGVWVGLGFGGRRRKNRRRSV